MLTHEKRKEERAKKKAQESISQALVWLTTGSVKLLQIL
jgi:hypothetical protein